MSQLLKLKDDSSSTMTQFLTQLSFSSFFSWKRFLRKESHSPSKGLDRKGLKQSRVHPHRPLMTFIKPARSKCFSPATFFLKPTRGLRRGSKGGSFWWAGDKSFIVAQSRQLPNLSLVVAPRIKDQPWTAPPSIAPGPAFTK